MLQMHEGDKVLLITGQEAYIADSPHEDWTLVDLILGDGNFDTDWIETSKIVKVLN